MLALELGLLLLLQTRRGLREMSDLGLLLLQARRGLWGLSDLGLQLLMQLSLSSGSRRAAALGDKLGTENAPSLGINDTAGRAELLLLQTGRRKRGLSD